MLATAVAMPTAMLPHFVRSTGEWNRPVCSAMGGRHRELFDELRHEDGQRGDEDEHREGRQAAAQRGV
ncbi:MULTISPECIES: hypothetical protein [unclassified Streptomyces]|uniref:hypothetical protein n=1 Tax=unclassified Streptomyces TaxID=2593676 RepID=UPI002E16BFD7